MFFRSSRPNGFGSPHGIALTTDGSKLYVGLENADIPGIVVYDTKANKVLKKIDVVLRGGHFLAIQPKTDTDSAKLYVMNSGAGDVAVIDLKEMKVAARHKVGVNPFGGGLRLTH